MSLRDGFPLNFRKALPLARLSQLGREFRYFLETICQFPNDFVENFSKLRLVQTQSLLNLVVELID
jgi:hypothetical protein